MKILHLLLLTVMVLINNIGFANMSTTEFMNELCLGGVYINMPYKDIVKQYGQPTRMEKGQAQLTGHIMYYGDSVKIYLDRSPERKVIGVMSTANNGWNTPSGIYVGMMMNDAIKIYGNPWRVEQPNKNSRWVTYVYHNAETRPAGYGVNGMPLELTINRGIDIEWDKSGDGKIKSIHVWKEEYDPVPASGK